MRVQLFTKEKVKSVIALLLQRARLRWIVIRIKAKQNKKYLILFLFLVLFISGSIIIVSNIVSTKQEKPIDNTARVKYKQKPAGDYSYKETVEPFVYENLTMLANVSKSGVYGNTFDEKLKGMVLRTLRYQNISRKVEQKYKLPQNILLAMIMQETGGADLLPNSSDDGGFGLCHMQPLLATEFGLKTYKNCNKLICKKHGKQLRKIIEKYNFNRKELIKYDDRLNPVLNIDAAGRMLAFYMAGKQTQHTAEATAIYGYAGAINFKKYYKNVTHFRRIISDKSYIDKVRKEFNKKNPDFTINGKPAGFDDYIEAHQQTNRNYGLDEYVLKINK